MDETAESLNLRTVLFMPGNNERAIEKAKTLSADAIVFDLEDAVAPGDKASARRVVTKAFADHHRNHAFGDKMVMLRVNAKGTPYYQEDLELARSVNPDAVIIPKVEGAYVVREASGAVKGCPVFVMIETPLGVIRLPEIASAGGSLMGLIAGANDLTTDLGATLSADRAEILYALQQIVLAARANGLTALDSVYNDFGDDVTLKAESTQALRMGFDGKTLIHPNQIGVVHEAFTPTPEQIADAKGLIAAYRAANAGVATYKGKMIEELHVRRAMTLISRAD